MASQCANTLPAVLAVVPRSAQSLPLSGLALGAPAIVELGEPIAVAVCGVLQQLLNMRRSRLPDFFRRLPSARLLVTEFGASVLAGLDVHGRRVRMCAAPSARHTRPLEAAVCRRGTLLLPGEASALVSEPNPGLLLPGRGQSMPPVKSVFREPRAASLERR